MKMGNSKPSKQEIDHLGYALENTEKKTRDLKSDLRDANRQVSEPPLDPVDYEMKVTSLSTELTMVHVENHEFHAKLRKQVDEKTALEKTLSDQTDELYALEKKIHTLKEANEKDILETRLREQEVDLDSLNFKVPLRAS